MGPTLPPGQRPSPALSLWPPAQGRSPDGGASPERGPGVWGPGGLLPALKRLRYSYSCPKMPTRALPSTYDGSIREKPRCAGTGTKSVQGITKVLP